MSVSKMVAVLGVVLAIAFFLPWIDVGWAGSGLNYALTLAQSEKASWLGFGLFLLPLGGLALAALGFIGKRHLTLCRFVAMIFLVFYAFMHIGAANSETGSSVWSIMGYGFWISGIACVALLVLSFFKSDRERIARVVAA